MTPIVFVVALVIIIMLLWAPLKTNKTPWNNCFTAYHLLPSYFSLVLPSSSEGKACRHGSGKFIFLPISFRLLIPSALLVPFLNATRTVWKTTTTWKFSGSSIQLVPYSACLFYYYYLQLPSPATSASIIAEIIILLIEPSWHKVKNCEG